MVGVANEDDTGLQGDGTAREAVWIATTIPALVAGANDLAHAAKQSSDAVEHVLAFDGVGFHQRKLFVTELGGLVENLLGDRNLAYVMEHRGELELLPSLGLHTQLIGDGIDEVHN